MPVLVLGLLQRLWPSEWTDVEKDMDSLEKRSKAAKSFVVDKLRSTFKLEFYDNEREQFQMAKLENFMKLLEEAGKSQELAEALGNLHMYH
jgi:hypothetical protein